MSIMPDQDSSSGQSQSLAAFHVLVPPPQERTTAASDQLRVLIATPNRKVPSAVVTPPSTGHSISSKNRNTDLLKQTEEKEFQDLLDVLRDLADKVIREDEWKYRSSDEILGFCD